MSNVVELTTENFDAEVAQFDGITVVDFWAPWCGPCKMLTPTFEAVASNNTKVKFAKVNVDEQPELASKAGIRGVPTLLAYKGADPSTRKIGNQTADQLNEWIDSLVQ